MVNYDFNDSASLGGAWRAAVQEGWSVLDSGFVTPEGEPIYVPAEDVERARG